MRALILRALPRICGIALHVVVVMVVMVVMVVVVVVSVVVVLS